MNINMVYLGLTPAQALLLVSKLAEFETESCTHGKVSLYYDAQMSPDLPSEASVPADPVPATEVKATPRRGRPPKVVPELEAPKAEPESGTPSAPLAFDRESAINKLRAAVKVNYEACEAWLDARSAPGFLGLNDADMALAVAELCA